MDDKVYCQVCEPSGPSGRSLSRFGCRMKRLGLFLLPPGWDASPSQVYPSIKFAGSHLYTWLERVTVRVKCLAQEHNTVSPVRARTRTAHPERSALTMRPPRLPYDQNCMCFKGKEISANSCFIHAFIRSL